MNVSRAASGVGLQTDTDAQAKDQALHNAVNQFQAKYGEKPKEARVVKKALDKDDFMRIMITEMKHQDPTKPMDSDRMATQMAQVTSVEQLKNVGAAIEKLADKNSASDRLAMSAMIGKTVTVDKSRFQHQKGALSPINFELPQDAQKVKLSVLNEKGEEIATRELEPMKAGSNSYNWDGINASNIQSLTGTYMVRIDAEDGKGNKISVNPISQETVVGVAFEGGEPNFLVGDAKNPQKVEFKNVTRIEGDATVRANAQAVRDARNKISQQLQAPGADGEVPGAGRDKISAQNPRGMDALEASGLPTGLQTKLKSDQVARAAPEQASENPEPKAPGQKAEGFPNGLSD